MSDTQVKVLVPGNHLMVGLLGQRDELLRLVESAFSGVSVHVRGNEITVEGAEAELVAHLFEELVLLLEQGQHLEEASVLRTIDMVRADERPSKVLTAEVLRSKRGRAVRPKTSGQKRYVDAIRDNIITFGVGPAGTGKSWLAVAMAVYALQAKQVDRIILTRPAVEAGERLGFLPGDLMAKIDPYLRPLYDALYDMVDPEGAQRLLDRGTVEVAPLAFMRGRTLNNSFIILDEAQNTTPEQMKMFLTRIGFGSRAVITGDVTQVDIAGGRSGLLGLEKVLTGIDGLAWVWLSSRDVVRHRIVQDIVSAYERAASADVATGGTDGDRASGPEPG
ncbi:MAG: PhoH family protein [Acidimicrobiales bacterium]|jgi:phosphate starvation-inducible PhoH-like protein|nr:PhoH family protein [Acidimicrobiales bacterium]